MYLIPIILCSLILLAFEIITRKKFTYTVVFVLIAGLLTLGIIGVDYMSQTTDKEVWSGRIVNVQHVEEYDETVQVSHTDSDGKVTYTTETRHNYAENYIETSDEGNMSVSYAPNGKVKFNDSYPDSTMELSKYYKVGTASASVHTYENKVQSSYSIFKHEAIDLKKYSDIPKYPLEVKNYTDIDRIIGYVPNKDKALVRLNEVNSDLNKMIINPKDKTKKKSWKEVNLIFVNVGDKSEDYGFALQDKWENGNKNDFVVAFSMDKNNNVKWVYPFSWSDVEMLKLEITDYMMGLKQINDFVPVIDNIKTKVVDKFERKQFADFQYLQINVSGTAIKCIWVFNILTSIMWGYFIYSEQEFGRVVNRRKRYGRY